MSIRNRMKKLIYGDLATADSFLDSLRRKGAFIGEGTTLFCSPRDCLIDGQNPYLLTIGKNVQITRGVIMLTHDYSWSVIKGRFGEVCGGQFPLTIGDNVFIGMNAVILGGGQLSAMTASSVRARLSRVEYPLAPLRWVIRRVLSVRSTSIATKDVLANVKKLSKFIGIGMKGIRSVLLGSSFVNIFGSLSRRHLTSRLRFLKLTLT